MELWIRSQDKETIMKIDRVDIDKEKEIWVNGYDVFVAEYNSKERALEVLDDIQKWVSGEKITEKLNKTNGNMNNVFPTIVYIMPED
jgi:hypothetical protein